MTSKSFSIENAGERIDKYLAQLFSDYSRNEIKGWIIAGQVVVNGEAVKANYRLKYADQVSVTIPEEENLIIEAENIPLDVLYEDDDLAVIIKPKGMVVHPGVGNLHHTLVNALLNRFDRLSDLNGAYRPGIVHRHDKDTSGVMVIAKTNQAHEELAEQFKAHTPSRHYLALVHNDIPHEKGKIDVPIGRDSNKRKQFSANKEGKDALTYFTVQEHFTEYALVEASLYTGRTHQIRVHFQYIGHPIVGDKTYGYKRSIDKETEMCLFANKLAFKHPTTGEEMTFEAPLPAFFANVLADIRQRDEK